MAKAIGAWNITAENLTMEGELYYYKVCCPCTVFFCYQGGNRIEKDEFFDNLYLIEDIYILTTGTYCYRHYWLC